MKKRTVILLISVAALLVSVGATLAYLVASSRPVINLFTVGDIRLSLTETTGDLYRMIPGTTVAKDPRLTVKAGSDPCWLFFKLDKSADLDRYVTYAVADGWTPLPGNSTVWYRQVAATTRDTAFPLLAEDAVQIKDTVTEGDLAAVTTPPTMTFSGYAIQSYGIDDAEDAWLTIQREEE